MTGPGGLLSHPLWARLAPSVQVEAGTLLATGRKHRRLELPVGDLTVAEYNQVIAMRVPCAACGSAIQPFRVRHGKSAGRAERPGRLFLALTCTLAERIGCSRGAAASAAYERTIRAVEESRQRGPALQLKLFGR